jgi:hypothetical protein
MIIVTDFAKRHFDPKFGGTKVNMDIYKFEELVNHIYNIEDSVMGDYEFIDGYADFCKLFNIENFCASKVGAMKIDISNYQYLRSGYSSRTKNELPTLSRWFELPVEAPVAERLMLVLYSREQLFKEAEARGEELILDENVTYGIVAILAQDSRYEEPMKPTTMLRNALGKEEGGSGVPLNREEYLRSVEFWKNHATVK